MNGHKPLFWGAIIAQVAGAQVFFWDALPDYRELTARGEMAGTPKHFAVAVVGLVIMQSTYWCARRLQPEIFAGPRYVSRGPQSAHATII